MLKNLEPQHARVISKYLYLWPTLIFNLNFLLLKTFSSCVTGRPKCQQILPIGTFWFYLQLDSIWDKQLIKTGLSTVVVSTAMIHQSVVTFSQSSVSLLKGATSALTDAQV